MREGVCDLVLNWKPKRAVSILKCNTPSLTVLPFEKGVVVQYCAFLDFGHFFFREAMRRVNSSSVITALSLAFW